MTMEGVVKGQEVTTGQFGGSTVSEGESSRREDQ